MEAQNTAKKLFRKVFPFLLAAAWAAGGCSDRPPKPDISGISVKVSIQRFEQDLFGLDTTRYDEAAAALRQKYPLFFDLFIYRLMRLGLPNDSLPVYLHNIRQYLLQDRAMRELYDTVQARFPDLSGFKEELETAYRYDRYYFPDSALPTNVITCITQFGYSAFTIDSVLGIGLDMFLGEHYMYYPTFGFPQYMCRKMEPPYMAVNSMKALYGSRWPEPAGSPRLIDAMIYNGKMLYYLDHVLPDMPDEMKIGYRPEDLAFCEDNEKEIWTYFIQHDLLYSTNVTEYRVHIQDGPATTGMPPEAPGNTGSWMGWQIVRRYMKENPAVTLPQLMRETDGEKILRFSKYKPG